MKTRIVPVTSLSTPQISRMFEIMQEYYVEVTWDQFLLDLQEKDDVILLLSSNLRIQGFSTLLNVRLTHQGQTFHCLFSGDTVLDKQFWGNGALPAAFGRYMIRLRLKNWGQPIYWFLMSKGYKTYLLMTNNFHEHYPRYEKPTPPMLKELMDLFYGRRFSSDYDSKTGLIAPHGHRQALKVSVADIDAHLLEHPRIRFFAEKNPQWQKGTELGCIAKVSLRVPIYFTAKRISKFFQKYWRQSSGSTKSLAINHVS